MSSSALLHSFGETLEIRGSCVNWIKNGILVRRFTFLEKTTIDTAIFASFCPPPQRTAAAALCSTTPAKEDAIVIVTPQCAHIYYLSGATFLVDFPCPINKVIGCDRGLILSRDMSMTPYDEALDAAKLPKFFLLNDPLLEFCAVVSSNGSPISNTEEILYFGDSAGNNNLCVTFETKTSSLRVYQTLQLRQSSSLFPDQVPVKGREFARRKSTRKSSSIFSPQEVDSTLEASLFMSRLDNTSYLNKDVLNPENLVSSPMSNYQNLQNINKEILLTFVREFTLNTNLESIQVKLLSRGSTFCFFVSNNNEASAIFLLFEKSLRKKFYRFKKSEKIEGISMSTTQVGFGAHKRTVVAVLKNDASIYFYDPFLAFQSNTIEFPADHEKLVKFINHSNTTYLITESSIYRSEIILSPQHELVISCFKAFEVILEEHQFVHFNFLWSSILFTESCSDWDALVLTLITLFIVPVIKSNPYHPMNKSSHLYASSEKYRSYLTALPRIIPHAEGFSCYSSNIYENIIHTLFLIKEDARLDISKATDLLLVEEFLLHIVPWSGISLCWDTLNNLSDSKKPPAIMSIDTVWEKVPDIFHAISESLSGAKNSFSIFNNPKLSFSNPVNVLPRLYKTIALFELIQDKGVNIVESISKLEITRGFSNLYPEGIKYCILEILQYNKSKAKPSFELKLLSLLGRDDLIQMITPVSTRAPFSISVKETPRDIKQVLNGLTDTDNLLAWDGQSEFDRIQISKLIFSEDRRFYEASILLQSSKTQLTTLVPSAQWSEMELLQKQKDLYQLMVIRICAISFGRAALYFSARKPLITEKYPIPKLNFTVQLKPSNVTMTLQNHTISEESLNWGYFHNGVSSGLSVSKDVKYLNGSWIAFNKPATLTSQHAGFLLGLGLSGHLKNIEEWHIYNYFGPKHTHTSIALLIGMAASNLGTMDTKLTRVLSVHIAALLPPGSSDLNVSTLVQTAGIIGIGLLYTSSQHRRMTETFLGEIEGRSLAGPDAMKNEGYKLASGVALGLINLGKGNELQGLIDIMVVERLLSIATKSKDVQTSSVLDVGVPGAIIALLFMFIQTSNADISRKLAPPQTAQFYDYIRPDLLQIRTLASHLIMWKDIGDTEDWVTENIPEILKIDATKSRLSSDQLSYFYVVAGLCMAIGLRHASTGNLRARNTLITHFDLITSLYDNHATSHDQRLTKAALGQIQSSLALSLAVVMAGTGDLIALRRIRMLCLLKNKDTTYGTFMAAQLALGILFLGAGQYGFDRNPLDIAALVISFYPILPFAVTENFTHLQPLRYLWTLAAKPRCLVTKDIETGNPIKVEVSVRMKRNDELIIKTTPFLLPELSEIAEITTCDKNYHYFELDLLQDTPAKRLFMQTKTLVLKKLENNLLSNMSFISKSLEENSDHDYYHFLKILQTIELDDVSEIKFSGTCTRALDTTKDDLMLTTQRIASSPKYADDLWNLKVIFLYNDKIKDLELSTLLPTGKVEELKALLWKWKMTHLS